MVERAASAGVLILCSVLDLPVHSLLALQYEVAEIVRVQQRQWIPGRSSP